MNLLPIKTIIKRARVKLHDTDGITYEDDAILDVANDGIRFIRRSIAQVQPELLLSTVTGTIEAGTQKIELEKNPLAVIEVAAGDRIDRRVLTYDDYLIFGDRVKIAEDLRPICAEHLTVYYKQDVLQATNLRHIANRMKSGTPTAFYRTGLRSINLFPVPDKTTAYTISTVDDIEEVTFEDNSPLINDFDDFLIEYIVTRTAIGEEYDMTQEQSIMANIFMQIQNLLAPPPPGVTVGGYWDTSYEASDYGRRY